MYKSLLAQFRYHPLIIFVHLESASILSLTPQFNLDPNRNVTNVFQFNTFFPTRFRHWEEKSLSTPPVVLSEGRLRPWASSKDDKYDWVKYWRLSLWLDILNSWNWSGFRIAKAERAKERVGKREGERERKGQRERSKEREREEERDNCTRLPNIN